MIARKEKMENNIYKRQATEALQILSKIENLSYVYNPLSDYIHYSERDLTEAKDKLTRRNMQIRELKKKVEELNTQCIYAYNELKNPHPNPENRNLTIQGLEEVIE